MGAFDKAGEKSGTGERGRSPILIASSNAGKLGEYRELAAGAGIEFELLPIFKSIPPFEESAPTFAENSAGKALHYSRYARGVLIAEDSGLVVPALGGPLGGIPGVHSARYAGANATDADRVTKLLEVTRGKTGEDRRARFICVTTVAREGRALAIVSDLVEGYIAQEPRGSNGFGYDPIFSLEPLGPTFAELPSAEKNTYSHRGRAFRKALDYILRISEF